MSSHNGGGGAAPASHLHASRPQRGRHHAHAHHRHERESHDAEAADAPPAASMLMRALGPRANDVSPYWSDPSTELPRIQRVWAALERHGVAVGALCVLVKSHNDNVVVHRWDEATHSGIRSEWVSLEKEVEAGRPLPLAPLCEPLSAMEAPIFGVAVARHARAPAAAAARAGDVLGSVELVVAPQSALANGPQLDVVWTSRGPKVATTIDGVRCRVDVVYAQMAKKKEMIPRVEYLNFYGTDASGGSHVAKVIVPASVGMTNAARAVLASLWRG